MILAVLNQKGGVGKTTIAFSLARMSAREQDTLAIDIDPQGSLTSCLIESLPDESNVRKLWEKNSPYVDPNPAPIAKGLSLLGSDLSLSYYEAGATAQGYFRLRNWTKEHTPAGWTIIDCPPNLGLFSINAMLAADFVLIPVDASRFTMQGLDALFTSIKEINRDLRPERPLAVAGIVLSNVVLRMNFARAVSNELRKKYGKWVMDTTLPASIKVREAVADGELVSSGPAMAAYTMLYEELKGRVI